jgi:hypothetical protein
MIAQHLRKCKSNSVSLLLSLAEEERLPGSELNISNCQNFKKLTSDLIGLLGRSRSILLWPDSTFCALCSNQKYGYLHTAGYVMPPLGPDQI